MKLSIRWLIRNTVIFLVIINLLILTSCGGEKKKSDSIGSGPTIEDMSNTDNEKEKDEVFEDAIRMSEGVMVSLNSIKGIKSSMVYINHEAVLIAVKLSDNIRLSGELEAEIKAKVYDIYPESKTIAISDDEYVYKSISKLLRSYKENDPMGEFIKDLQEILKDL